MNSNDGLIDYLVGQGVLYDSAVEAAMRAVDRAQFVPRPYRAAAYSDQPLPLGFGQTISAPHMVAIMTQHLSVQEGMNVLEIGSGSGYQAAVLAQLVGPSGVVHTIERIPELAASARKALSSYKNVGVVVGSAMRGLKEHAPYDRMLVACAAHRVPEALKQQLAEGGRTVIPISRGAVQELTLVEKLAGTLKSIDLNCSCLFVPLMP
ncbi:MAG: protein-L-isoaspartate O-methyltransferase [Candidatus Diapherotrites archaeon]|nr:protein-L-isoaspartate O-methyltransferase [Candidatus Diapherotrites archaeon]